MSLILNEKYIGKNSYKIFISNRLLRLLPAYWVVLGLTLLLCTISYILGNDIRFGNYIETWNYINPFTLLLVLFSNILILGQDIFMFLGIDTSTGLPFFTSDFTQTNPQFYKFLFVPQAWTIGVEIFFYLIAPFLVRKKNIHIGYSSYNKLFVKSYSL